jgi:DNA-binding response OmpR family regulator
MVTVDVAKMQKRVADAEAVVVRVRQQYEKLLAEAQDSLDDANETLAVAKMSLKMVLEASVPANGDTAVVEEGADRTFRNLPTKVAVLRHLEEHRYQAFSIDDLVAGMARRGFQGSRNAVLVAISRIRTGGGPITRVRPGKYQFNPKGRASDGLADEPAGVAGEDLADHEESG